MKIVTLFFSSLFIFLFLASVTLAVSPVTLTSDSEQMEGPSRSRAFIPPPEDDFLKNEQSYSRNWYQPLRNIAGGAILLGCSYFAPDEYSESFIIAIGAGIMGNNALKIFGYAIECFWNAVEGERVREEIGKSKNLRKDPKKQEEFAQKRIEKSSSNARIMVRQALNLTNLSMKFLVLYNGFQNGNFNDSDVRNHNLIFMSLIGAGAANNLNEIIHCWRTGQDRKYIPIFEIFDGICEIALGRYFFDSWATQNLELAPGIILPIARDLTNIESVIYRSLLAHGDCQALNGFFQIPLNALNYIRNLKNKKIVVEEMPSVNFFNKRSLNRFDIAPSVINPPSSGLGSLKEENEESDQEREQTKFKEKLKTRKPGNNSAQKMDIPNKTQYKQNTEAQDVNERDRKLALNHLQTLRTKDTLKKREVNEELSKLFRLLPNTSLETAGHNKKAIILHFENGRKFKIVYEEPHQQRNADADEYKGYRKDRVLDALQVAYLYGWDEQKIRNFLSQNSIIHFYNLPEFLIHILWTRGQ